jgi:uncharacterized protein with FMN-binding domain
LNTKALDFKKKINKFKRKTSPLKITRFFVQVIFLYFFSGFFTLAFTGFKSTLLRMTKEDFSLANSFTFVAAFATVVVLSFLAGRIFCGWLCAFGTFNDFLYFVGRKIFKKKLKISEKLDRRLKFLKYIILVGIIIFIWFMNLSPQSNMNPWDAFAQIPQAKTMITQIPVAFIILAFIAIGAMFIERFFCRYLCPLGAVLAITSKFKIMKISKPSAQCGKCTMCTHNCPMGINLSKVEVVDSGECISCFKCVDTCHRSNPQVVAFGKLDFRWYATATAAILIFALMFWGKKFVKPETKFANKVSTAQISEADEDIYTDGVYTGIGKGFRPNLKVEVKILKGKIADIKVISHDETKGYYEQAFDIVPKEIIAAQSVEVDTVSGATKSSNGIKSAVGDALNKARKKGTKSKASENNAQESTEQSSEENKASQAIDVSMDKNVKFKDGVYTGVGTGYQPGLTVSVTIKDGKIVDIKIVSSNETAGFKEKAFAVVPKEIIVAQSTSVDAVSGATFSSRGVMAAVKNALQKAVISGELPADSNTNSASANTNGNSTVANKAPSEESTKVNDTNLKYKDGVYEGIGQGFGKNLRVSVKVSGGKIANISILSHNETKGFYEKPFEIVPKEIIEKQSTNVDAVSGATYSSRGVMAAVRNALSNAVLSGEMPADTTPVTSAPAENTTPNNENSSNANNQSGNNTTPSNSTNATNNSNQTNSSVLYKDGQYNGVGRGFSPNLKVLVTVKDGKISEIKVLEHDETEGFYEKAFNKVPKEIIEKQSTVVDTVSGATRSSKGIIEAVNNALKDAVVVPNNNENNGGTNNNTSSGTTTPGAGNNTNPGNTTTNPAGNGTIEPGNQNNNDNSIEINKNAHLYKDGIYTGIGKGRRSNLIVDVTIKDNKITNIRPIYYREDREYFKNAMEPMAQKIITAQSTEVDVVSGATQTSDGIKEAVNNAVDKALYKDGTFAGSARGYNRKDIINVKVTVKEGKLTNIDLVYQSETPEYFEKVWPVVPKEIIKAQSTFVDTVSGATRSSNGVINAVKTALAQDQSVGEVSNYPSQEQTIAPFRDGIYKGTATGYKENLNVSVTVKDNKIMKIDLGDNQETQKYFSKAWPVVPNSIIDKQSASVDTVSGATRSSLGIINAVKDALRQSKLALTADPVAPYKDGTYRGIGKGYKDGLNLDVTVKDNKVVSIDLKENNETQKYFEKAWKPVSGSILEKQSTQVDTISGATRSSNGIIDAVKDALRKAHDATLN